MTSPSELRELEIPLPSDPKAIRSFRDNLASGGIFAPASPPPQLREKVQISLISPDGGEGAALLAEVVHVAGGHVGLQVVELTQPRREAVEALLDRLEAPPTPPEPAPEPEPPADPAPAAAGDLSDLFSGLGGGGPSPSGAPFSEALRGPTPTPTGSGDAEPAFARAATRRASLLAGPGRAAPKRPRPAPGPRPAPAPTAPSEGIVETDLLAIMGKLTNPEISPDVEQELFNETLAGLLVRLSKGGATGRLVVEEQSGGQTRAVFAQGKLVAVHRDPEPDPDSVAYLLMKKSRLNTQDYYRVKQTHQETGQPYEHLLWTEKVPKPVLAQALSKTMSRHLLRAFTLSSPQWTFTPGREALDGIRPLPLSVERACYRGLYQATGNWTIEQLNIGAVEAHTAHLARRSDPRMPVGRLGFKSPEKRFWEVTLEEPMLLQSLSTVSALSRSQTWRCLYALRVLGMVEFLHHHEGDPTQFLESYRLKVRLLSGRDHFQVLRVHWTVLGEDIEEAYRRLVRVWKGIEPPRAAAAEFEEIRRSALSLFKESYDYLKDDNRRRAYRDELIEETQRTTSAGLLVAQVRMLMRQGNMARARYKARVAVDLAPNDPDARKLRGMF